MHLKTLIILPIIFLTINSQFTNFNIQHILIEYYLTIRNLDNAVLFTCWSLSGNIVWLLKYFILDSEDVKIIGVNLLVL